MFSHMFISIACLLCLAVSLAYLWALFAVIMKKEVQLNILATFLPYAHVHLPWQLQDRCFCEIQNAQHQKLFQSDPWLPLWLLSFFFFFWMVTVATLLTLKNLPLLLISPMMFLFSLLIFFPSKSHVVSFLGVLSFKVLQENSACVENFW